MEHAMEAGFPVVGGVVLLRMEDAAARLGIARTLMYELVRTGQIETVRIGRLRRVPVACLDNFVERLRSESEGSHDAEPASSIDAA